MGKAERIKRMKQEKLLSKNTSDFATFGDLCIPFFEKHGPGVFNNSLNEAFRYFTLSCFISNKMYHTWISQNDFYKTVLIIEFCKDFDLAAQIRSFPLAKCPLQISCPKNLIPVLMKNSESLIITKLE